MSAPRQSAIGNLLLAKADAADFAQIAPDLRPVSLAMHDVLVEPNAAIQLACFPDAGVASVLGEQEGRRIETGLIGREGVVNASLLLGADRAPWHVVVQVSGAGHSIARDKLMAAAEGMPRFRLLLLRFLHTFMIQTAQTAVANGMFTIERRLARWLLMCHDRVSGDTFAFTHEFLASMLAITRPGVTLAVNGIEGRGVVKATRGQMRVVDRAGLEAIAGEAYGVPEAEYERLIAPLRRRSG